MSIDETDVLVGTSNETAKGSSSPAPAPASEPSALPFKFTEEGEPYIDLGLEEYRLTPWRETDVDDAIALYNHPDIGKWSNRRPYPYTRSHADFILTQLHLNAAYLSLLTPESQPEQILSAHNDPLTKSSLFPLGALRHVPTGKVVGDAPIFQSDRAVGDWEIAYNLSPDHWGKGVGTRMVKGVLGYAKWLGVIRIVGFCEKTNIASAALLTKSGFKKVWEGEVDWPEDKGGGHKVVCGFEQYLNPKPE